MTQMTEEERPLNPEQPNYTWREYEGRLMIVSECCADSFAAGEEVRLRDYLLAKHPVSPEPDQGDANDHLYPTPEYNFWDDRTHDDVYSQEDSERDLARARKPDAELVSEVRAALANIMSATPSGRLPDDDRVQWLKSLADRLERATAFVLAPGDLDAICTALLGSGRRDDLILADRVNKQYGASARRREGFLA